MSPEKYHNKLGATDMMSMVSLSGLVLLYGLVISLYTLTVRSATFHTNSEDSVKQAASELARAMSSIYVEDPIFGKVGIADHEPSDANPLRVTSLNRLYAGNRIDTIIAKRVGLPQMWDQCASDLARLHKIEKRLRQALDMQVDSNVATGGSKASNNWYARAFRKVSGNFGGDESLVDLRVRLGTLDPAQFTSGQRGLATDADGNILKKGQYRANMPISSGDNGSLSFYQLAAEPQLCEPNLFADSPVALPSAVLVEATFKSSPRSQNIDIVKTRMACGIAGGIRQEQVPSAFMISFPHGMPPNISTLRDLLTAAGRKGNWQQATGGDVPGKGHLAAPIVVPVQSTSAGQAVELAFYHWLRSLGPDVQIDTVINLLDRSWAKLPGQVSSALVKPTETHEALFNSALTKDSSARAFSLLYQSGPGGAGQAALTAAFEASADRTGMPHGAIPLQIDVNGNCNLPAVKGFDSQLLKEFLASVYGTNLAAMESQALARSIIARLESAMAQIQTNMAMTGEELNSVKFKLEHDQQSQPGQQRHEQLTNLDKSRIELDATLAAQKLKLSQYEQVINRAKTVISNSEAAARLTFDISSHMDRYARFGIARGSGNPPSFILSNETIFTPLTRSVTEEQLYRPEVGLLPVERTWTNKPLTLVERAQLTDASAKEQELRKALPRPRFIILDSRLITSWRNGRLMVLSDSPFNDTGVPNGQVVYYTQDCIRSGTEPKVGWSVLIRDLMANGSTDVGPLPSSQPKWFSGDELQSTTPPGLAVEVQVRAPVPLMDKLPSGASLIDPETGEHIPQIPPMPASML